MNTKNARPLGLFTLLFASAAIFLATGSLHAQSIYGGVRGSVTDASGAAIPNAKVTLGNDGTGEQRFANTTTAGEYTFNQVIPGAYTVSVEAQGFKKVDRKGVNVATQSTASVDVALEVGNVTESVVITSEVPLIETATASQGQVIDNQKLADLPNTGRNPFIMAKLTPNVQLVGNPAYMRMQDQSGSSTISFAGGPVRGNNYLLDGVPITDMANRAVIIATIEAVQEMKVQTNTYDAEVGRTGGGMFNVLLKSGTNQYHGSAGFLKRNTEWEANAFFANRAGTPRTDQPNKTYYGSIGGPVRLPKYNGKDRTFFWIAGEGYRDTQGNSGTTAVPTLAERGGDFSNSRDRSGALVIQYDPLAARAANGDRTPFANNTIPATRIDKVGSAIAATFAKPTSTAAFGTSNVGYSGILPSVAGQGTIKFDHKLTNWWTANISSLRYHSNEPGENWFPDSVSSPEQWLLDRIVNATQINNTIIAGPTTVIAVRYGFNRFPNDSNVRSAGFNLSSLGFNPAIASALKRPTFPVVNFQNYYSGDQMGAAGNNAYFVPYSRNLVGMISKFSGRHSLKAGADWRSISNDGIDYDGNCGSICFTFNDQFTRKNANSVGGGSDIASLLLGYPAAASAFQSTKLRENIRYTSAFLQDDIRLSSRLTINAGIRWEHETGLTERNNSLIVGFDPNALNSLSTRVGGAVVRGAVQFAGQNGNSRGTGNYIYNKFSPRLGMALKVNDKTVIRGGWGIFWAPPFSVGSPYTPEGATATTATVATTDGGNTPNLTLANPFVNGVTPPSGTANGDATGLGNNLTIFDRNSRGTWIQQFSFDIQRELPWGIAGSIAYVGSRSYHVMLGTPNLNINQLEPKYFSLGTTALNTRVNNPYYVAGGPGIIGSPQISQAQLLRPFPAFGNINIANSDQNLAQYDSVVIKAQKRLSKGLSLLAVLTVSKNRDRSSGGVGSNINGGSASPQNVYDLNSEWALSIFDAAKRYSMTGSYDLPFGRGRQFGGGMNRAADALVGGWSFNVVNVISTGYPLIITQSSNNNSGPAFTSSQRPNASGTNPQVSGSVGDLVNDRWTNPAAFSTAPALTFGNVSRTIPVRGPQQFNWDASIFKSWGFGGEGKYKLQYRFEMLNATNTPYFRSPNGSFGSANFGKVLSQGNFPRFIQMGARFQF